MNDAAYFKKQYHLIQYSRNTLLEYCNTLTPDDFVKIHQGFGHASVRDMLVHVANSYLAWLSRALKIEFTTVSPEYFKHLAEIKNLFSVADDRMNDFIKLVADTNPAYFEVTRNGKTLQLTPLQIFSHVTTHEFHHKGQVLSLSRQLGYIPVDTDILR